MNTAEFLNSVEKTENQFFIYRATSYRWEQTADPIRGNESLHLTLDKAIEAAMEIKLDVGHHAIVEKLTFDTSELEELDDDFEIEDFKNLSLSDTEEVERVNYNNGGLLPRDGYIVWYKHHRYMNYAYTITEVEAVKHTTWETYCQLVDDSDDTFTEFAAVYDSLENLRTAYENGFGIFAKINKGAGKVEEIIYPD